MNTKSDLQLLAATVNLPDFDRAASLSQIQQIDESNWFWEPYRGTSMLPLMTMGGKGGKSGTSNFRTKQSFLWCDYVPTSIQKWFDDIVFPWMGMRTRVMILRTQPGAANFEHIDCSPSSFGTLQHKFRVLLQGKTDTLYFITKTDKIFLFDTNKPFIIDGSWPHGMVNNTSDVKYTIAVGAPWCGNDRYLNLSNEMYCEKTLLPKNYTKYFDPKYLQ
jgi:hypothetical protein